MGGRQIWARRNEERTRTPRDQERDREPHIYRQSEQEQEREEIDLEREVDERATGVTGGREQKKDGDSVGEEIIVRRNSRHIRERQKEEVESDLEKQERFKEGRQRTPAHKLGERQKNKGTTFGGRETGSGDR